MTKEFTWTERELLRNIARVLQSPRNRFGKIETSRFDGGDAMHNCAEKLGLLDKLPHGGSDQLDKAAMILSALIGDKPESIMDR